MVLAVGGKPGESFTPSPWEWFFEAYEQPTDEGIATMKRGIEEDGERGPLYYHLACLEARDGQLDDGTRTSRPRTRARPAADRDRRERRRPEGGSVSGYAVTTLDEIPKRDTWIPVRDHFGIGAFGVNAYRGQEAGAPVISDHTELMAKHEELYVVVEGHATFTVDGEEVDAPAGTLVFVSDPASRRSAVAKEAGHDGPRRRRTARPAVRGLAVGGVLAGERRGDGALPRKALRGRRRRAPRGARALSRLVRNRVQPRLLREHGRCRRADSRRASRPRDRALPELRATSRARTRTSTPSGAIRRSRHSSRRPA